jgi:hypothetical protein
MAFTRLSHDGPVLPRRCGAQRDGRQAECAHGDDRRAVIAALATPIASNLELRQHLLAQVAEPCASSNAASSSKSVIAKLSVGNVVSAWCGSDGAAPVG